MILESFGSSVQPEVIWGYLAFWGHRSRVKSPVMLSSCLLIVRKKLVTIDWVFGRLMGFELESLLLFGTRAIQVNLS